jgi:hypothetical protein
MGQPVRIVSRRNAPDGSVRYELDRSLTGTDHEVYTAQKPPLGDRPPDILAARLLDTGTVQGVHIHSNVLTLKGSTAEPETVESIVHHLYTHYLPGVKPTAV